MRKNKPSRPELSDAVRNFDELPDNAFLRTRQVLELTGLSRSSVWRKAGNQLPAPVIRINRAVTSLELGLHRGLLARWFVLNQHKSRIASELKVPRPMIRKYYQAAFLAVIAKLQRQDEA